MRPVGYLTKYPDRLEGERGAFYDYVLASNGVFIETEGRLMAARVPVTECAVRGLAPLEPKVVLRYGKIPGHLFDLALSEMLKTPDKESYIAITFSGGYHINVPEQAANEQQLDEGVDERHGSGGGVAYLNPDSVMLDLHSHGTMSAFFSPQDDRDEQGMKLYGVVGKLNGSPGVALRVGVYGYFHPIAWGDVFEGTLQGITNTIEGEEVIDAAGEVPEEGPHKGDWLLGVARVFNPKRLWPVSRRQ